MQLEPGRAAPKIYVLLRVFSFEQNNIGLRAYSIWVLELAGRRGSWISRLMEYMGREGTVTLLETLEPYQISSRIAG